MNNFTPPSTPQRSWGIISIVFGTVLALVLVTQISMLWPSQFGDMSNHTGYFRLIIEDLLLYRSTDVIQEYEEALVSAGIRDLFLVFLIGILLAAIGFSSLVVWVLFLRKGAKTIDIKVKGGDVKRITLKKRSKPVGGEALHIHPQLKLSIQQLIGNIFTSGAHGTGKSTFIKFVLSQLIGKNNKAVILFDEKREYTELYFKAGSTFLIAPWDNRSFAWDIHSDLKSLPQYRLFAEQLIPVDDKQPIWGQGAREIFVGLIVCCRKVETLSWVSLSHWLKKPLDEWRIAFEDEYPVANKFICGAEETVSSFLSNLSSNVGWIHDISKLQHPTSPKVSFSEWLNADNAFKTLIIQSHPMYGTMMTKLASAAINYITADLLSKEDNEQKETWLVVDELGNLPKLESLAKWLSLGRSKGARTIAGTQNIAQIKYVYGENISETILSLFKNHVVFQCGAIGKTAEFASKTLGQVIFERPTRSIKPNGEIDFSWHRFTENLVPEVDIVNLKNTDTGVVGFAKVSSDSNVYKLEWEYNKDKRIASATELRLQKSVSGKKINRLNKRRESKC